MDSTPPVLLEPVPVDARQTLANLIELYVHDLSAAFEVDIGADGRFGYDRLERYFSAPESHFAYFIRRGGRLAGFALVTRGSPASDDPNVLDVAELFVLRRHRRARVGHEAARQLFAERPGRWIVRVSEANLGALGFWREVIAAHVGSSVTPTQLDGKRHRFEVYAFDSPPRTRPPGDER
jgi:predicted acetyltransferase